MITVRARARAPASLHRADRGPQNPSDIGPGSPNHGGGGPYRADTGMLGKQIN